MKRWHDGVPPAFLVGLALSVVGGAFVGFAWAHGIADAGSGGFSDRDKHGWFLDFARHGRSLLGPGISLASSVMLLLGFAELARRAGPSSDGIVLRIGLAAAGVLCLTGLASMYINFWYQPRNPGHAMSFIQDFMIWRERVMCGAALLASASLLIAGRGLFIVQALAVPLVLATLFAYPVQQVWEMFHDSHAKPGDLMVGVFIDVLFDVGFATLLLIVVGAVGRALPPAPVDVARAGDGLQRVGSALLVRVLVVVVAAFTLVTTFGAQSVGLARMSLFVFPLALLLTSIALVTGMFQAASLSAEGAPRLRLYAAGACTLIAFVADAIRALVAYNVVAHPMGSDGWARDRALGIVEALPYAIPAFALAGLLLLLSAVERMRQWAPEARADRQMVINAAAAVSVFSIVAVVMLREASPARSDIGFFILISILVAIANILAQVAVARVCHRVAEEMREAPALPTAVIAPRP